MRARRQRARAREVLPYATVALTVTLLLGGCVPSDDDAPSEEPTASSTAAPDASESPSATPEPTASASAKPVTPVGVGCLDLVSLDTMYAFDPNFALVDDYAPAGDSLGARAVEQGGVACRWQQLTNGETIEITAARPTPAALERLRGEAGANGDGEVFASAGGAGAVQVFGPGRWVTATSAYFGSADDARTLVDSAVAALG